MWHKISCERREQILSENPDLVVTASKTDMHGEFGDPEIYSMWSDPSDREILYERRYPSFSLSESDEDLVWQSDRKPCEHYEWAEEVEWPIVDD